MVILSNVSFIINGSINFLDSCICYCRCITSWAKFFWIGIQIGLFLFFPLSGWNITMKFQGVQQFNLLNQKICPNLHLNCSHNFVFSSRQLGIIQIFQWPLLFDPPLIITIYLIFTFLVLSLRLRLCLSRSATRYSCFHLFHGFSLHRCTYLGLFVHSSESSSAVEFIVLTSHLTVVLFDVNTFNWMSSSR